MADHVYIDPDGIKKTSGNVQDLGSDFGGQADNLDGWADALDGCWGDDDSGQSFAQGYVKDANTLRDNIKAVVTRLNDWGQGVEKASENLQGVDDDSARQIDSSMASDLKEADEKAKEEAAKDPPAS